MSLAALHLASPQAGEEGARAELYGLLARLWLAPPDAALLARFAEVTIEAPRPGDHLQAPWREVVEAMRATDAAAAVDEYDALFGGVGKPELLLYASFHLTGFLNERPLAALRQDLRVLGLGRDAGRAETEDHAAYLFEVMRYLIAGDDGGICHLEGQRAFFRAHLQPWIETMCDSVERHPRAVIWRAVAGLTRAFVQVEAQGFDLLET